jgi:hypothetical protein
VTPVRFVSRDNAGGTQRNLARFLDGAGITRTDMLLWNCVPWIVHALARAAVRCVALKSGGAGNAAWPACRAAAPDDRRAGEAVLRAKLRRSSPPRDPMFALFTMPHPSPANVCTSRAVPAAIRDALSAAAARRLNI